MKIDNIILCEPENTDSYYPFEILHPVWEIRCGALRLFEKAAFTFPESEIHFSGRDIHLKSFLKRFELSKADSQIGNVLLIDASVLVNKEFYTNIAHIIYNSIDDIAFILNNKPVAAFLRNIPVDIDQISIAGLVNINPGIKKIELDNVNKLDYLWDAIFINGDEIENDLELLKGRMQNIEGSEFPGISLIGENIWIGKNVSILPGVVIDSTKGPVIIDDNVKIMPQAAIVGPCYIGKNSLIKIGAKIYKDCSFGEFCKIGGELENTIIQSYSNKQHDGFLGHSFIGEWVNFGADTNNSDLKNTYGNIKIKLREEEVDSGRMFLGLLCGDHTKTAINSAFNTGTTAGICGIIVHEGLLPNFIPSFAWTGRKNSPIYKVEKAIEVAKIVMKRRNRTLIPEEEELIRKEYAGQ